MQEAYSLYYLVMVSWTTFSYRDLEHSVHKQHKRCTLSFELHGMTIESINSSNKHRKHANKFRISHLVLTHMIKWKDFIQIFSNFIETHQFAPEIINQLLKLTISLRTVRLRQQIFCIQIKISQIKQLIMGFQPSFHILYSQCFHFLIIPATRKLSLKMEILIFSILKLM